MLMCWRAWHLRNDAIHATGQASVVGSARFLISYSESLHIARQQKNTGSDIKGKDKVFLQVDGRGNEKKRKQGNPANSPKWEPPPAGWVKANVDAGFVAETGEANSGVIIRDATGAVILSARQARGRCALPEDAEALAILEGIRLAVEWVHQPTVIETDCWSLAKELEQPGAKLSNNYGLLQEIRAARCMLPDCRVSKVRRGANVVAYELAQLAMKKKEQVVMSFSFPFCVRSIVESERPVRLSQSDSVMEGTSSSPSSVTNSLP